MRIQIAAGLSILSLAIVSARPVHAASLNPASLTINDSVEGPNIMFSENNFQGGFDLNGIQVQIGLGSPAENGAFVDGAAEDTFSGSWLFTSAIVPDARLSSLLSPDRP
jgi:hypothetical protein